MKITAFKYLSPLTIYALALISFTQTGFLCWLTIIYIWIIIPAAELFISPDNSNMAAAEEELAKHDKFYDIVLYFFVIALYPMLFIFLHSMQQQLHTSDIIGRVFTMGMLCGAFGINIGHELGHRSKKFEQFLAKASLLTSLYLHFFIEHNKGHHKNVATKNDPASARMGEPVYTFYFRTIFLSYADAWKIANDDQRKKHRSIFSLKNEMIQMQLIQIAFVLLIFFLFGLKITLFYLCAAFAGILLLETVNYIEHYGLRRKEITTGKFERAMPAHSWNSNHSIGRIMLFELSRHSDHHYLASRKYQILRHHDHSPQMPTGYPGMMILSLIPPAWFYVMHRQMRKQNISTVGIK